MLTSLNRLFVIPALLLGLVLAGCAETELVVHTAKKLRPPPSKYVAGAYKIGKPYQVEGVWYYPKPDYTYRETGIASWYGPGFHGRRTANGERYDQNTLTAAHRTLPMPSIVRVTNLDNGRSIKVRINDRGPFSNGRIIDLSQRGADLLGFRQKGTAKVLIEIIEDESRLLASSALTKEAAANIPSPAPLESVDVEALPGTPAPTQATTPAASQTAAVVARRTATVVRQQSPLTLPDDTVTTLAVRPTNIFVQAGSFTRVDNALRLRARLSQLGNVQVAETIIENRRYFRVRLGPMASVKEADEILAILLGNGHPDARVVVD
ncbi:MAG: septal ring lytic transglycosylase RlpA family protein [Alphaproteobacteria bacterium]